MSASNKIYKSDFDAHRKHMKVKYYLYFKVSTLMFLTIFFKMKFLNMGEIMFHCHSNETTYLLTSTY